jgi:hypothetical protein
MTNPIMMLAAATALTPAIAAAAQPAATALPAPAEPSAAALELARLLAPTWFVMLSRPTEQEAIAGIENKLLGSHYAPRGSPCDPEHPACIAAARELARKYGPLEARFLGRVIEEGHARMFDATLSGADIAAATAFLRSGSGRNFAGALRDLWFARQEPGRSRLYQAYRDTMIDERDPTDGLFDEFYDRTAGLPRMPLRNVPPPPPPPSPRPPRSD